MFLTVFLEVVFNGLLENWQPARNYIDVYMTSLMLCSAKNWGDDGGSLEQILAGLLIGRGFFDYNRRISVWVAVLPLINKVLPLDCDDDNFKNFVTWNSPVRLWMTAIYNRNNYVVKKMQSWIKWEQWVIKIYFNSYVNY